jgi:hypothetical protein
MAKKKGLWDNIHAKRKRGESPSKKGDKDYPETLNIGEGLKKARKNVGADTCWDGYKAKGTKKKDGKEVPNCVKEGKTFSEFCFEAYDKPEERLNTDRNMFSIPKADQKSAEERLMAKAKAKREEKAKMKKESMEILDVDGNMVAEITDLISPEPMSGWKQQMDEAAWTRKEGKNKAGGLNEKGRKSYERENPGSDLKAPQPEGGPRKKSFCARMGGMKGPLKDEKGEPTRKKLALDKWKC